MSLFKNDMFADIKLDPDEDLSSLKEYTAFEYYSFLCWKPFKVSFYSIDNKEIYQKSEKLMLETNWRSMYTYAKYCGIIPVLGLLNLSYLENNPKSIFNRTPEKYRDNEVYIRCRKLFAPKVVAYTYSVLAMAAYLYVAYIIISGGAPWM